MKRIVLLVLLIYLTNIAKTQLNPLFLTVPFLLSDINSKTGGMGEIGIVSTAKSYFTGPYRNPSLLIKTDKTAGISVSCLPDISKTHKGDFAMNIMSFYRWNDKNVIGGEFTYLDMGESSSFTLSPYEYFISLNYAHSFNNKFSAGAAVKYIHSDLCGNSDCNQVYKPARTFAVDLGLDYENQIILSDNLAVSYDLGAALENLGPRISYTDGGDKYFLPSNLAIGSMVSFSLNINEKINLISSVAYQAEKLLVPTPPEYYNDSIGADGEKVIREGRESPSSLPLSWIQSFYDAPGGFTEEWHEILHKFGAEACVAYTENIRLALRCGRHYEHWTKGNNTYNTFGAGLYIYGITLDAKLITGTTFLNNTYGFTAGLQLDL